MKYIKLKDVCKINMGQSPDSSSYNESGEGIPFFQGNADFGDRYPVTRVWCSEPKKIAQENDILISVRAPIGAINYSKEKCCIGRGLAALTVDKTKISEKLLFWVLKAKKEELNRQGTGSTFKAISKKSLEELLIPQIDIKEQEKYVEILEKIYMIIQNKNKELKLLTDLISARFVEIFGDLMFNPNKWPIVKISDISISLKSGLSRKLSNDDIGLPVIRSGNIQNGQFVYGNIKYWYKKDPQGSKIEDYILDDGDILINFINSISQIGKTTIFRNIGRDCIYTTNILRMKLTSNCNEYYYNWFAMSDYYFRQLKNIIQPAVNQASFTTANFLKLSIPLPPIELQNQFAAFVQQINKSKFEVQKSLEKTQLLFDSLMQEYFG